VEHYPCGGDDEEQVRERVAVNEERDEAEEPGHLAEHERQDHPRLEERRFLLPDGHLRVSLLDQKRDHDRAQAEREE
jgi:hypothetical protein